MIANILILIVGLTLIIGGGNYVTNGSVAIADRFHLSPMLVGLTVVALGSSTPDLAVSLLSTLHAKPALAVGNIVGAVTFDMLLVVGIMAAYRPIAMDQSVRRVDMPIMALGAMLLLLFGTSHYIDHSGVDAITRTEAIGMLLVFIAFMVYNVSESRRSMVAPPHAESKPATQAKPAMSVWMAALCIVGGLVALVGGGELTVRGASAIAKSVGMSEALIGITVVGIGGSLPDLATSLIASTKGQNGLALGNIVGSCVMDILMVIGVCGTVRPLNLAGISPVDFIALAASAVLLTALGLTRHKITRGEGAILILLYVAYLGYLILSRS